MDVDSVAPADSVLPVRVQIQEARPRLSLAELGYISEGAGFTGRVQWNHPNFTGGARSLTASVEAQTGAGAIGTEAERLLRGSLNLAQPYVFAPRFSLLVGPLRGIPRRPERQVGRDRSFDHPALPDRAALFHRTPVPAQCPADLRVPLRRRLIRHSVSPSSWSTRIPALIDSLGRNIDKSSLTLTGSFSRVDDLANPRRGWLLRPSAEVTVPAALTTVQFARLDLTASGFYPLSRNVVLASRISAGRLFPFGKSVPAPGEDPFFSFIRLRDESMTAGGHQRRARLG